MTPSELTDKVFGFPIGGLEIQIFGFVQMPNAHFPPDF